MRFFRSKQRKHWDQIAHGLYSAMVEQSRQPVFYAELGVPDTLEGRFDMLCLHISLLLRRLGSCELTQALVDVMFADMDVNLRESGVSDLRVGPKVRKMAEAFYGRLHAYEAALDGNDRDGLIQALLRNLYRAPDHAAASQIATYVFGLARQLEESSDQSLQGGHLNLERP